MVLRWHYGLEHSRMARREYTTVYTLLHTLLHLALLALRLAEPAVRLGLADARNVSWSGLI